MFRRLTETIHVFQRLFGIRAHQEAKEMMQHIGGFHILRTLARELQREGKSPVLREYLPRLPTHFLECDLRWNPSCSSTLLLQWYPVPTTEHPTGVPEMCVVTLSIDMLKDLSIWYSPNKHTEALFCTCICVRSTGDVRIRPESSPIVSGGQWGKAGKKLTFPHGYSLETLVRSAMEHSVPHVSIQKYNLVSSTHLLVF